jgi:hypothetical protein
MRTPSRTPEGHPNRCLICGNEVVIEPSDNESHRPDAPCPHCGSLLWFREGSVEVSRPKSKYDKIREWMASCAETPKTFSNSRPIEIHQRLVEAILTLSDAIGGAIWIQNRKAFDIAFVSGIDRDWIRNNGLLGDSHQRLLRSIWEGKQAAAVPPFASRFAGRGGENPARCVLLCIPFQRKELKRQVYTSFEYVLEIFQRPELTDEAVLRELQTVRMYACMA